ncbi:hypothetical protein CHS0354_016595 [Potamilus streckersoni]|uniref:Transmembrane protein 127 transmembrane region domain-containing protein n=1 Tax=Potamilus streckersoni TaxID=2493646 RepID=A0AAE0THD0_9BIVA|nr:hypothetical protein CHS0354_016595 [Potamilus streckersoni]
MPRSSSSREPGRRSRSSSRRSSSRRHHHHHHSYRHSRLLRSVIKYKERNLFAAVCSMVVIVILCTALAEPKWVHLQGGGCMSAGELHHLGAYQFFYPGRFLSQEYDLNNNLAHIIYQFGSGTSDIMDNCVTYRAVLLMKMIISFCFLGIICSLGAFILDLVGPTQRAWKILRRNAILSIITVIITVVINLFCYWLTTDVEHLQKETKRHTGSKVDVTFDISFYLVTAAGGVSILATAFNCLKRYPIYEDSQGESLLEDYDGMDATFTGGDLSPLSNLPPPPAYSP